MAKEHALIANFNGNPNLGLYGFATDRYCLIGKEVPEKYHSKISEVLGVPLIQMSIGGTSLLGVFLSGNNKCLLIPKITFPNEIEELKKHKIPFKIIDTKLTCLGNNIICNDKGCIVSGEFGEREIKQLKDALKIPVERAKIAKLNTLGSLAVHTKRGILCHHDILDHEAELVNKILKINVKTGTVNMGNPFVGSGILCNNKGFLIGDLSGGPEIVNADECLFSPVRSRK